jgi:hypothetical protein
MVWAAALALAAPACRASSIGPSAPALAPMELGQGSRSVFAYLAGKYDDDGDGRIEPEEYHRGGEDGERTERFARLDRDGDGVLTAADLIPAEANAYRARHVLAGHFQADDDTRELRLEELEWMAGAYDADGDGAINGGEFAAGAREHRREVDDGDPSGTALAMLGDSDPWELLLAAADEDRDRRLGAGELVAFFHALTAGQDVLSLRSDEAERGALDTSGVAPGEPAPDFTLSTPDGGERVTLSRFRGERPVALVFGSYT